MNSVRRPPFGLAASFFDSLTQLELDIRECTRCNFGDDKALLLGHGNPHARIMCVGEGPSIMGEAGDPTRVVFGKNSREAYELFLALIGENWSTVWTTNIVKCSKPKEAIGGRVNCLPFFKREVEVVNPAFVVLFGWAAITGALETFDVTGLDIKARHVVCNNRTFIGMYHPMQLYRHREFKNQWITLSEKIKGIINAKRIEDWS